MLADPLARAVAELVATVPGLSDDGPARGGHAVRGRVRGAEGVPVGGASVTLISLGGRQLSRSTAGPDGTYRAEAPGEGTYVLIASADGHQPQAKTVVVGASPVTHDVLLTGSSGLAGVVRSADGGIPVAGAVVIVADVRGDVLATVRTDGDGEFSFTDLVPGAVTLAVNSPEHRPLALPVEVGATGITRVDLELRPGAQVRGTVRGAGAPLGDARVTLVDAAGNVVITTTTGSDGAYAFSDLDSGTYTVIATGYPPRAESVSVSGGDVDRHDIELAHAMDQPGRRGPARRPRPVRGRTCGGVPEGRPGTGRSPSVATAGHHSRRIRTLRRGRCTRSRSVWQYCRKPEPGGPLLRRTDPPATQGVVQGPFGSPRPHRPSPSLRQATRRPPRPPRRVDLGRGEVGRAASPSPRAPARSPRRRAPRCSPWRPTPNTSTGSRA